MRISERHGLNSAIPRCFFCQEPKNEIILAGRLPQDAEAPQNVIWDMEPCDECRKLMALGIILISVKDGEMEQIEREHAAWRQQNASLPEARRRPYMANPYRTGGWVVMTAEALERVLPAGSMRDSILRQRWAFVPDEAWKALGIAAVAETAPHRIEDIPTEWLNEQPAHEQQTGGPDAGSGERQGDG